MFSTTACQQKTAVAEVTPSPTPKSETKAAANPSDDVFDGNKVVKTEAEWKAQLTADEFHILREEGTEPAGSGEYAKTHDEGTYYCRACHLKLFDSKTKFESGTGWPSFYQPINAKNVTEKMCIRDRESTEYTEGGKQNRNTSEHKNTNAVKQAVFDRVLSHSRRRGRRPLA